MSYLEYIKEKIGEEVYSRLELAAEKEVAGAMQMALKDQYGQDKYFKHKKGFIAGFSSECELFEDLGLKISPIDVVNILFRCKLLFACKDKDEYCKRIGGAVSFVEETGFIIDWRRKSDTYDSVLNEYFDRLGTFIRERTLLTNLDCFYMNSVKPQELENYFEGLFTELCVPFVSYFEGDHLVEKYLQEDPSAKKYNEKLKKRLTNDFFAASSFGFSHKGTELYCLWYQEAWLRTFLNVLKVSAFLNPGQMQFGQSDIEIMAPKSPVFLGSNARGCFCWDEDEKESWLKTPDGCLFQSFGYRGYQKMYFDSRTFESRKKFIIEHKLIFEYLKNPWNKMVLNDIAPTLDILSSVTHIPDLGAKILLLYCCLEHLLVPKNLKSNNRAHIVGGINALDANLLPWFNRLYEVRCDYAHKGFILKNEKTLGLIFESVKNVMNLLVSKLRVKN